MREVLTNGLLSNAKRGQIFVEMSTLSPDFANEIRESMRQAGIRYLDAPVVGSMYMIEQGLLKIFASGDESAYKAALPFFKDIGRSNIYLGSGAQARYMKIAVNIMICSYMTVYSEILLAGESMGFSWDELTAILEKSPGACPMLTDKGTTYKERIWESSTALTSTAMKDLGLALDCANGADFSLPLTAVICQYDRYMHFSQRYGSYSTFGTIGVLEDWCGKLPGDYPPLPTEKKANMSNALTTVLVGVTTLLASEAARVCRKTDIEWNIAADCLGVCHGASQYFKRICDGLPSSNANDTTSIEDVRIALNVILQTAKERGLFVPILATACQELNRISSSYDAAIDIGAIIN
jgi:3-hydroxyisobutyrate dehydrogenase-like beta-hydroxyacid dehydrogenase